MAAHAAESESVVPPMPERTPKALREAIAQHAPELLPDFDKHWKRAIADAYDVTPLHAFVARWWVEYAIARDPELDAHLRDLEHRAAESTDSAEAKAFLEDSSPGSEDGARRVTDEVFWLEYEPPTEPPPEP